MTATVTAPERRDALRRSGPARRRSRTWNVVKKLATWALLATVAWLLLPLQLGGSLGTTVVSGHSMEPTYWTGDLVVTWDTGDYEPGDVVVYRVPEGEPGEGFHVVHRVIEETEKGLVLLGDNNDEPDFWTPTDQDVLGEVVLHVPQGGHWMQMLLSPLALALLCGVLVMLAVLAGGDKGPDDDEDDGDGEDDDTDGPDDDRDDDTGGEPPTDAPLVHPQVRRRLADLPATRRLSRAPDLSPSRGPWIRTTLTAIVAVGVALPVLGAVAGPGASASTLGGVQSSELTALRIEQAVTTAPAPTAFTVERQITSEQPTSYCAQVQVTNTGSTSADWEVTLDMAAAPYTTASISSSSNVTTVAFVPSTSWTVRGVGWNSSLAPGASRQFQYCGQRPEGALTDVTTTVSVTSSNATSYCANVTVSTTSTQWVRWRATIGRTTPGLTPVQWLDAQPGNSWNVSTIGFNAATQSWVVRGVGWNDHIKAGQPQTWGYCAPYSQNAPLTDADASVSVTSQSGNGANMTYCATVTVSTTSSEWVRWRTTIGSSSPGLAGGAAYRLTSAPQPSGAVAGELSSQSNNNWSWTLTGTSSNMFVKAGSPATWSYCKQ